MAELQPISTRQEQIQATPNEAAQQLQLLQASVRAGLTTGTQARKGTFGTATTGIFGQAREETGIPAFGGIFGVTGRQARKRVEGNIENFNNIMDASGIVPTEEMNADIRQAFESGMGQAGAKAIVDAHIFNSPEAIAAREEEARRAQQIHNDNVRAAADTHKAAVRAAKDHEVFMGVDPGLVREDRQTLARYQGAVDDIADLGELVKEFGPIRGPAWLEGDRARAKQAYEDMTSRLTSVFQELFKAEAMSDRELEFIMGQIPAFDVWADMTNSQRQVALSNMNDWITREANSTIQSNRALREGSMPGTFRPGQARPLNQILATPLPTDAEEIEAAEAARILAEQQARAAQFTEEEPTPTQRLFPGLRPEPEAAVEQARRAILTGAGTGVGEVTGANRPEEEEQGPPAP